MSKKHMYYFKLESINKGQTSEMVAPRGISFVKTKCKKESHSTHLLPRSAEDGSGATPHIFSY